MWFRELTGFVETSPDEVRSQLVLDSSRIVSQANGRVMHCGQLELASLDDLRGQVETLSHSNSGKLQLREVVADVRNLHTQPLHQHALFQVASQFNLLEMIGPNLRPEDGIDRYENDPTQGPACAIACGAGTIYRNYFVPVDDKIGQTEGKQIDCLEPLGRVLGNKNQSLWKMQNGYALPSTAGLQAVDDQLKSMSDFELDHLRSQLEVGIQWDSEVTIGPSRHQVSQLYCSAMPVGYSRLAPPRWERFARLVLESAYEATFCAAVLNLARTGSNQLFLTLLGGGAFGNDQAWILDAIRHAALKHRHHDLNIAIVSYRTSNPAVHQLCTELS